MAIHFEHIEFSDIQSGDITIRLREYLVSESQPGWVPVYRFDIFNNSELVGHIEFRAGITEPLKNCDGHIGYQILHNHRGNRYAEKACKLILPFIMKHDLEVLVLTSDFDNQASNKTIGSIGATLYKKSIESGKNIYHLNLKT